MPYDSNWVRRIPKDESWKEHANCLNLDPELFFNGSRQPSREVKSICNRCDVQLECLVYGLDEKYGVWGGAGEIQRRRLRRIRRNNPGITAERLIEAV